jgi:hypothetical protein
MSSGVRDDVRDDVRYFENFFGNCFTIPSLSMSANISMWS